MTPPRSERAYRRLLRLLPAQLRREAEVDLVALFRAEYSRVPRTIWSLTCFWLRIVVDTMVTAMAEVFSRTPTSAPTAAGGVRSTRGSTTSGSWRHAFRQDLRASFRTLSRAPGYSAGVVLTLAIGIGANAAVFSILQAVLFQPLPYERPDEVVMIWRAAAVQPPRSPAGLESPEWRHAMTTEDLKALEAPLRDVVSGVAPFIGAGNFEAMFDLRFADRTERLRGVLASPNFFEVLGARAALGRLWTSADDASSEPLVVLSDGLWRRAFGADPAVVGRSVTMALGRPQVPRTFRVIGVLSPTFRFTYPLDTEAWGLHPWAEFAKWPRGATGLRAIGRLEPDATPEIANGRLSASRTERDHRSQMTFRVERISEWVQGNVRPSLWLLGGVSALLLLITCVTVSGAQFVRVSARRRELAVRAALGASRVQLIRRLFTEGAVMAGLGTAAGVLGAVLLFPVLRALMPAVIPRGDELRLNMALLLFAAMTAGIVTVLSSLMPAWRGSRVKLAVALAGGLASSADRATVRWRQALIAGQAAIASVLLVASVLLLVSFWQLLRMPLGFDASGVLTAEMRLLDVKYRNASATGALARFQKDLVERLQALPGIVDVGLTSAVPFRGVDFFFVLTRVGGSDRVGGNGRYVDSGYFRVMGLPVTRGRAFSELDTHSSPKVVMVSEAFARAMFGDEDPIGQSIDMSDHEGTAHATVLGVVGDVRYRSLAEEPYPAIYIPRTQSPQQLICVVIRTSSAAGDVSAAVRRVVHDLDPAVPIVHMGTVEQVVSDSIADRRFFTSATTSFAAIALLLTAVGLSVVVARVVVERRRELAIRAALGATNARLIRLAAMQGLLPVVAGVAAGVTGAAAGAHVVRHFLFNVTPRAPWVYALVAALIVLVGAIAALLPARRAMAASPASALRHAPE